MSAGVLAGHVGWAKAPAVSFEIAMDVSRLCPRVNDKRWASIRVGKITRWQSNIATSQQAILPTLPKMLAQQLAAGAAGIQVPGVDDGEAEAARRHGVLIGRLVLVKGDLHAGHGGDALDALDQLRRRMAIARAVRPEQHHAIAVAAVGIGERPLALLMEPYHRRDPAGAVEVRPLIAHAQMHLDHATADGLGVEDAGEARKMLSDPGTDTVLDRGIVRGVHRPVLEGALRAGCAGDVAPPGRVALDHRHVGADMAALEQAHPHVAGSEALLVLGG